MCHVSEFLVANRPFTPPHPWFRRTGGGQPRPMVWAGGRMIIRFWGVRLYGRGTTILSDPQRGPNMAPKMADPEGPACDQIVVRV